MKRARGMLISFGTLLAIGCGMNNYDYRIEQTLERMKYERRLDENLMPEVKGRLEELGIYIRPPKNLAGPTQTFQFAAIEPGRFDLENTFLDADRQSLHILARVDLPKAAAKKGDPAQPEAPPRGDFNEEVIELIRNATGSEIDQAQFKEETKQVRYRRVSNTFRTATVDRDPREMQVYLYGTKTSPQKVALIFEYLKSDRNAVAPKIALTLENFLVGDAARQAFSGGNEDDIEAEGGGEAGPPI
ncbi:hypothetical protein [Paludisphaera sp.]|uniref:hypothetical protein n=1 Tax=Paludisphaera sp. TaxID=2017432 RepID=UPI00301DAAFF